ncbi:MAG: DNA polymerase III subunit gamma/tau [Flavobacteriales bacterium]|nr:DNA polymerase III subunit gamma/tau [Flavobacteriales bacterium]MCX7768143.1 DNA polymerase III subunit gamma/tau [Flavobacteriales bacterium]MDW8409565.1 DNA polymerase III subunit gamma/tau [Flavobacteriales bacterium]
MAGYIVSARKYRPVRFDEVVGQAHVTETLKNAVRTGKVAHAFLFCGPRGVGKTTTARILAKIINCLNPGPDYEPCNQCASCLAFKQNNSFNIHELDAASNNSVNDIRQLIEQVRILPQVGKYSVYIIDEAHMLTQQAFNAFLKTLEEPPAHAVFILATTEKHKIIPTVLSRCQVFDFARISTEDISRHLAEIARKEQITYDPDVLFYIAKKADGGLRDALSIFDRLVNFCGNHLSREDVFRNLYILDHEHFFRITDYALEGNHAALLSIFDQILSAGFEGQHFIMGLAEHFRSLLVARSPETLKLLDTGESIRQLYQEQASRCSENFLYEALNLVNEADLQYPSASSKRFFVEVMLMRLAALKKKPYTEPLNPLSIAAEPPERERDFPHQDVLVSSSKDSKRIPTYKGLSIHPENHNHPDQNGGQRPPLPSHKSNDMSWQIESLIRKVDWLQTLQNIKGQLAESEKDRTLYTLLETLPAEWHSPRLVFRCKNKSEQNLLQEHVPELRRRLGLLSPVGYIPEINVILNEAAVKPPVAAAISPKELFQKMAGKNPALESFSNILGFHTD